MCFCRRGSPLLIGVRSEHKLSTDHIPILYRTGKHQHPLPRTFPNTQTHGRAETTHTCVLWNTCYTFKLAPVNLTIIKTRFFFLK